MNRNTFLIMLMRWQQKTSASRVQLFQIMLLCLQVLRNPVGLCWIGGGGKPATAFLVTIWMSLSSAIGLIFIQLQKSSMHFKILKTSESFQMRVFWRLKFTEKWLAITSMWTSFQWGRLQWEVSTIYLHRQVLLLVLHLASGQHLSVKPSKLCP